MLFLHRLSLTDFKNYGSADIAFRERVTCICGPNGEGKTNLLDAIHYLCLCRSYFNPADYQNIRHDRTSFYLEGSFTKDGSSCALTCRVSREAPKEFKKNGAEYERLSEHIGLFPAVMVCPSDQEIILGEAGARRRFFDLLIGQCRRDYVQELSRYNRILARRDAVLRQDGTAMDEHMLASFDEQLSTPAGFIHECRQIFLAEFIAVLGEVYYGISGGREKVECLYESQLHDTRFRELAQSHRSKDLALRRSTAGIHRDDYIFTIDGHPARRFGSQGQQKSLILAMKLAQHRIMARHTGTAPFLLLDDLFDRLDAGRIANLLRYIKEEGLSQVFITDTQEERTLQAMSVAGLQVTLIRLNGKGRQPAGYNQP